MGRNNGVDEKSEEVAADFQGAEKPTGFDNIKNSIADKLHDFAESLAKKKPDQDRQSGIAQYGKQVSELLDQSAKHVRQFDYEQADTNIREYVGQNPKRSILIAGGVGLIIGALLNRK